MWVENFGEVGQGRAHLYRQRELADEITCAWANQRCAEQNAIIRAGHDQGNTCIGSQCEGAAIGGERETA